MIKALTTQVIRKAIEDVGSLGEQPPTAPAVAAGKRAITKLNYQDPIRGEI